MTMRNHQCPNCGLAIILDDESPGKYEAAPADVVKRQFDAIVEFSSTRPAGTRVGIIGGRDCEDRFAPFDGDDAFAA